jgi:Fur family ferric uptake transcriptional regulator
MLQYIVIYMEDIQKILREKKLKKTPLRLAIIEVFLDIKSPITISALEKNLCKKNIFPNQTSLYRQIDTLIQSNILESIIIKNSIAYYEIKNFHHHHFLCKICEKIECIKDENLEIYIDSLERELNSKGYQMSSHQFSFYGKCKKCNF